MMREDIYSEEHQMLREILKRERLKAGLRQKDVADKTNRSQEYISKFERGGLRLDLFDFLKICEAIGCNPYKVIEETGGPPLSLKISKIRASLKKQSSPSGSHKRLGRRTDVSKIRPPGMPPIDPD